MDAEPPITQWKSEAADCCFPGTISYHCAAGVEASFRASYKLERCYLLIILIYEGRHYSQDVHSEFRVRYVRAPFASGYSASSKRLHLNLVILYCLVERKFSVFAHRCKIF